MVANKTIYGLTVILLVTSVVVVSAIYFWPYLGDLGNDVILIEVHPMIISDSYYNNASRDPLTINKVELRSNSILKVEISYGGGCKAHNFSLIGSSFMESNPVQVNVLLSHDANDDLCEAWLTEDLYFDLSPLKEAWQQQYNQLSGTIIIHLHTGEDSIDLTYEF